MSIFHMCDQANLASQLASNGVYYPPTYAVDGFIHASDTSESLLPIANHFYVTVPGEWVCIKLDANVLGSTVVYEAPAPVGNTPSHVTTGDIKFPHIYGGITAESILETYPMKRRADGSFECIEGLPGST